MIKRFIAALAGCVLSAGCFSLEVAGVQAVGLDSYTREQILADPTLIELAAAGTHVNFYNGFGSFYPYVPQAIWGEELTSARDQFSNATTAPAGFANGVGYTWIHVEEVAGPSGGVARTELDNTSATPSSIGAYPWLHLYRANSASVDFPREIKARGIRIIDPLTGRDNTQRLLIFNKWVQGLSHVMLGLIFDSAAIVPESVILTEIPVLPFRPYREVLDSGIKWLQEAADSALRYPFLLPIDDDLWVHNVAFTSEEMAQVSHSFIARALVYGARTPAEREASNWALVKEHIAQGIRKPYGARAQSPNSHIQFAYRRATTSPPQSTNAICTLGGTGTGTNFCSNAGETRVDLRIVGPADSSGEYQKWLDTLSKPNFKNARPFVVMTADKRIQASTAAEPTPKPTFFKFTPLRPPVASFDTVLRGYSYLSNYWNSTRALDNGTQFPGDGGGRNRNNNNDLGAVHDSYMDPIEMDLLLAEAEFRLGNVGAAVDLINKSRVPNGELEPVTAAGVPVNGHCVPRLYNGTCGSLWDALMYEKRIETYGRMISYFDLRGWGCLIEGTLIHQPVPGQQLELMGKPGYTYGGAGRPGGAPKPTNCPLLHKP